MSLQDEIIYCYKREFIYILYLWRNGRTGTIFVIILCFGDFSGRAYNVSEPVHEKTNNLFPTRSDTNRPVQVQKIARSLIFWI